jgi:hypothetical protein
MTAPEAFFTVTVSPLLARLRVPVVDATALVRPVGMPEAAPNTTSAWPPASTVPEANVWRIAVASQTVHPLRSMAVPPTLTSSMNSPAVAEPSSLARISLRMTRAGMATVKGPLLVSTGLPSRASEMRTRALEEFTAGNVQDWEPREAGTLTAMSAQLAPLSSE